MPVVKLCISRYAITACICLCCWSAIAADWPQWRGPNLDGISTETEWSHDWPATGPEIVWQAEVGIGFSSFAVVGEQVYTLGHTNGEETVFCFDAGSGNIDWSHSYPAQLVNNLHDGGPSATPTVHEGRIYSCSKDGRVICFAAEGGDVIWEVNLQQAAEVEVPEWGFTSSALIHEDEVIFEAGRVVSLSQSNGEVRWRGEPYRPGYGTPTPLAVAGEHYFASLNNDGLVVVSAENGALQAFHPWETDFATTSTSPIVLDNQIFISTGYNRGCSLLGFTGRNLLAAYENKELNNHFNQSILIEGCLYGIHGNSHSPSQCTLRCVDWATGEVKWTERGFGCGSVTAAGERLIILSDRGVLVVADVSPDGYRELARAEVLSNPESVCWTVPVIANGRIYCRNSHGNVVSVNVADR
jgi:outer membrane protein assembly factor BamB